MARICSLGRQVALARREILVVGDPCIKPASNGVDSRLMVPSEYSSDSSSLSPRIWKYHHQVTHSRLLVKTTYFLQDRDPVGAANVDCRVISETQFAHAIYYVATGRSNRWSRVVESLAW